MKFEIAMLTLVIEFITILGRLKFGTVRKFYKKHHLKLRIHHGYVGIVLVIINAFYSYDPLLIIGMALVLSDIIHHFIVLPLWVGRTEFP